MQHKLLGLCGCAYCPLRPPPAPLVAHAGDPSYTCRYRLTGLAAVSWFDVVGTPDRAAATFDPIRFVIGAAVFGENNGVQSDMIHLHFCLVSAMPSCRAAGF